MKNLNVSIPDAKYDEIVAKIRYDLKEELKNEITEEVFEEMLSERKMSIPELLYTYDIDERVKEFYKKPIKDLNRDEQIMVAIHILGNTKFLNTEGIND